jgi:hypothetical protein
MTIRKHGDGQVISTQASYPLIIIASEDRPLDPEEAREIFDEDDEPEDQ